MGAPTGSASRRTTPASRSAVTGTRTAKGSPRGPTTASTAVGNLAAADLVHPLVPHRAVRPRARRGSAPRAARRCPVRTSSRCAPYIVGSRVALAAGPDEDPLGPDVDVDVRAAAVLDLRRALHEDHRRRLGEQQRDVRVGDAVAGLVDVAAHDGDVDAALRGVVARAPAARRPGERRGRP